MHRDSRKLRMRGGVGVGVAAAPSNSGSGPLDEFPVNGSSTSGVGVAAAPSNSGASNSGIEPLEIDVNGSSRPPNYSPSTEEVAIHSQFAKAVWEDFALAKQIDKSIGINNPKRTAVQIVAGMIGLIQDALYDVHKQDDETIKKMIGLLMPVRDATTNEITGYADADPTILEMISQFQTYTVLQPAQVLKHVTTSYTHGDLKDDYLEYLIASEHGLLTLDPSTRYIAFESEAGNAMHNAWAAARLDTTLRNDTNINVTTGISKVDLFGASDSSYLTDDWATTYKDDQWIGLKIDKKTNAVTVGNRDKQKVLYDNLTQDKLSDILNFVVVRYVYDQLKNVLPDLPVPKAPATIGGKCINKAKKSPAKGKKDGSVRRR